MSKHILKFLARQTELGIDAVGKVKKTIPHRIKYRGEFIRTLSGKTVWPSKSAASNALNLELQRVFGRLVNEDFNLRAHDEGKNPYTLIVLATKERIEGLTYQQKEEFFREYMDEVKKEIEIIPVSADEFYQKKSFK